MKLLHHPILRVSPFALLSAHRLLLVSAEVSNPFDDDKEVNEYEMYNCANANANNMANMNKCFCGLLNDRVSSPADDSAIASASDASIQAGATLCTNGFAGSYPCNNVDLLSFIPNAEMNAQKSNDIWGWTDTVSGREFALIGNYEGTSFIEITNPENPVNLGKLPSHNNRDSSWRDIKTYNNYAFIVSEASSHGMQVFDLSQLLTASQSTPTTFSATARYSNGVGNLHNLFINEDSATAYLLGGTNGCSGGLHMVDISDPLNPVQSGCFSQDGYTHDAQCVIYNGPDTQYLGNEICFAFNEDTVTIVDVTDKSAPVEIKRVTYAQDGYTHQGWLSDDHRYVVFGDETDERNLGVNTKTLVVDANTLAGAIVIGFHYGSTPAIDHNQYIKGDYIYQANYRAGMQVLKVNNYSTVDMEQVAFFDVYPSSNSNSFNGAWSVYPFFPSGTVVISGIEQGLFVTRVNGLGLTSSPTISPKPTKSPTDSPSKNPTLSPSKSPSKQPTLSPAPSFSLKPTFNPTVSPSKSPSKSPITTSPSKFPTMSPTPPLLNDGEFGCVNGEDCFSGICSKGSPSSRYCMPNENGPTAPTGPTTPSPTSSPVTPSPSGSEVTPSPVSCLGKNEGPCSANADCCSGRCKNNGSCS